MDADRNLRRGLYSDTRPSHGCLANGDVPIGVRSRAVLADMAGDRMAAWHATNDGLNIMSAEIIQFIPKPNPNRPTLTEAEEIEAAEFLMRSQALIGSQQSLGGEFEKVLFDNLPELYGTDCGNIGWPWPEDKA
jgi:hypothetical protein